MSLQPARLASLALAAVVSSAPGIAQDARPLDKLSHIVVLYLENRSFDNLFGEFPGANGLANTGDAPQRDRDGKPFATLPSVQKPFDRPENPAELRAIESLDDLPNRPFPTVGVRPSITPSTHTRDRV